MDSEQLRALADALSSGTHYVESPELHETMMRAADYLRAQADAEPVAWRVECRWLDRSKGGDWRKYADYGTAQAASSSQQVFANPGDIESRIVPLYPHPAPATPQIDRGHQ